MKNFSGVFPGGGGRGDGSLAVSVKTFRKKSDMTFCVTLENSSSEGSHGKMK